MIISRNLFDNKKCCFGKLLRLHLFLMFYFLSNVYLNASEIDSLLNRLSTTDAKDKIEIYKSIGTFYHSNLKYDSALYYYSLPLEQRLNSEDKLFFFKKIGNVYVDSTNYSLALEVLNKALHENQKVDDPAEYSEIYNLIGMCYGLTNKLEDAIVAFEKSLEYNQQISDSAGIGLSYYNIGLANHFIGLEEQALENFVKSANIRQQIGDTTALVASLISVGEIFRLREDYNNARIYYNEALKYKKTLSNKETLAYLYSELALIYKATEHFETALVYIDTAMDISHQIKYKRGIATLQNYKAGIFRKQGKTNEALDIYFTTIELYREIGFETGVVQSNIAIAEMNIETGEYNSALTRLNSIETLAESNKLLNELVQIADLKYTAYKSLGNKAFALEELEHLTVLKDSLFNIEKEEVISEIETKYQTEKKEKQIELLDKESSLKTEQIRSRNLLVFSLAGFILLLTVVFILFFNRKKTLSQLEIEKNRHQLLRAQMNPHFIFNALSAIQNFILKNNPMDSLVYISEFSSLTRLVLEGARCDLILLKDEIQLIGNYLKLQQLRFQNKFEYEIITDSHINTEVLKIPPMLSQPFIENAVEHGMRNKSPGEGKILVKYSLENTVLTVTISDNGEGIDKNKTNSSGNHKSLATKITKERIENIRKTLNLNVSLNTESDQTGTTIKLIISQKK